MCKTDRKEPQDHTKPSNGPNSKKGVKKKSIKSNENTTLIQRRKSITNAKENQDKKPSGNTEYIGDNDDDARNRSSVIRP